MITKPTIMSVNNELIKELKSLKMTRERKRKGIFIIEGERIVMEAFKENAKITKIVLSESFIKKDGQNVISKCKDRGVPFSILADSVFRHVSDTENPQGILALVKLQYNQISMPTFDEANGCIIVLDSIQDPGNLGTIIRTADAAGVLAVIMSKGTVDPYNAKVLRSTMGSIFRVSLYVVDDLVAAIKQMKASAIKVYAACMDGKKSYLKVEYHNRSAIVIGNEANGINKEVLSCVDEMVRIPMNERVESLNASVAAALLMYEVNRKDPMLN